jgi:hypothetical protein
MNDYKNALLQVKNDPNYEKRIEYGEPRDGHPEGSIKKHIEQLERNLYYFKDVISEEKQDKIRFLIHVHDTFKADSEKDVEIENSKSHSSIARKYAEKFISEESVLQIIQFHDFNYYIWKKYNKYGFYDREKLKDILEKIEDIELLLLFTIIDGTVKGKDLAKLKWFYEEIIKLDIQTNFKKEWLELIKI